MFGNNKKEKNSQEGNHYEYKVRRNGSITQKPTDVGYTYARIKNNPALDGLEGVDDYDSYTTRDKRGDLVYKFEEGKEISDFNFADSANKEVRAAKRAAKGKSRKGTAFTLYDDDVADKVYRAIAGNSNVEYSRIRYKEGANAEVTNYIETDKIKSNTYIDVKPFINGTNQIVETTHSHPYFYDNKTGEYNSKYPSDTDKNGYITLFQAVNHPTNEDWNQPEPDHTIYHPVTPDEHNMPYYVPYNHEGALKYENGEYVNMNVQEVDKNEKLYKSTYFK